MEYVVKEIKEEIDIMYLTKEEYDSVNKVYFDIMTKRNPRLLDKGIIGNVKKCILTDGLNRVEVMLMRTEDKAPFDEVLLSTPPTDNQYQQQHNLQQPQTPKNNNSC